MKTKTLTACILICATLATAGDRHENRSDILGCIQILCGLTAGAIVIYDANAPQEFEFTLGGTTSRIEYDPDWTRDHTAGIILSSAMIAAGITTIVTGHQVDTVAAATGAGMDTSSVPVEQW